MKKLFLSVALVLALGAAAAPVQPAKALLGIWQEKVYKQIEPTAVPAAILKEITEKYPGYVVKEAYAAEDGSEYKIVITKGVDTENVYYTAAGEFVKEEKKA